MQRTAFVAVIGISLLSGCFWSPELAQVRRDIERQVPEVEFEKEMEFALGPLTIGFVRVLTSFTSDTREVGSLLSHVKRIQVAVYRAESVPILRALETPRKLERLLGRDEWHLMLKAREEDQVCWILYRIERDSLRNVYLVALDQEELVMIHLEGSLDRLITKAIANRDNFAVEDFSDVDTWTQSF